MAETKIIRPIAWWKTRSWLLGGIPAVLTFIDTVMQVFESESAVPVANAISLLINTFGGDLQGEEIAAFMKGISPLYAILILHQRRGLNRPYVASTEAEKQAIQVIELGEQIGKTLKR